MKNIEIKTTQNVVLEYELADLRERIAAFLIDAVCLGIGIWMLSFIGFVVLKFSSVLQNVYFYFLFSIFIFYSLAMEVLNNGQSIGKMALRIRVIKTTGIRATLSDYAARWVFRMIDIYFSMGGIASILIASSGKAQRVGDMVANTAVVRIAGRHMNLDDLLAIHSNENYVPTYPQVKRLEETDVLLIKEALDRQKRFHNQAHREATSLLAAKVSELLGVEMDANHPRQFLQTVLKDYVVLTR